MPTPNQDRTPSHARPVASACAWLSLLGALAGAALLVAMEVVERRRVSDSCTVLLDRLMWATLAVSSLALIFGLVGIWGRGARPKWLSMAGIIIAVVVAGLILIPRAPGALDDIGSYVCGSSTP
ncbi:MAG: hypothetical protein WBM72_05545 [Actinomycetota bacterium]